ncbi:MAG TPA: DNA polymerase III subunit alpha, partial [Firmicutes bacterium]|nr:DNA polymerase III subunit alpha [Bacillota bacterium]
TMPDIDIDFEDTRRADVIEYVKNRYGERYVSLIIAYGTLAARAAVRDVAKAFSIEQNIVDKLCKMIDAKKSLKDNLVNASIVDFVKEQGLEKIYKISMRLEGIKKNTTVHAAGVVISSVPLNSIIPTFKTSEGLIAGYSMEYLEMMGLLKMDFLALSNLNVIHRAVDSIKRKDAKFDLNKIPLNDAKTYKLLSSGDTDNIFQFETPGMRNFIKKLDPENFDDLIAAVALFRPGPMKNIDEYIARRKGRIQVSYVHSDLKSILESTYGIIVYQEQIMQILSLMGGYSYAEADLIRRAMSKKKKEVMVEERERFIDRATKKGYEKRDCEEVYDLIVRFANYGFNKAHSVAYALIGYQMAYMKANYRDVYHVNTLNMNIGSNAKIKDVIEDAKNRGMRIVKPSIAKSDYQYKIENDSIILPLTAIKNISTSTSKVIIDNQPYVDYFDFFRKVYGKGINRGNLELLIKAGALDDFGVSRSTLLDNIDSAETYMELISTLDESLVEKPALVESQREDEDVSEIELFGFYISGHPASKYQDKKRIKLKDIGSWMNRRVEVVGLVEKLKVINTKKGEKMAFLNLNDETGTAEAVVFPKNNHLLNELVEGELSRLSCTVNKRDEKMQLVVEEILKLS